MATPRRIIKTNACAILALGILLCCTGCGTMGNSILGVPKPYAGVRNDLWAIGEGSVYMAIDLPFSAVADTLLLASDVHNSPPSRDPLEGWKRIGPTTGDPYQPPESIKKDIEQYLAKQKSHGPPNVVGTTFYEDGTDRHAVRMEIHFGGYRWYHVLIYDQSNVRSKAIKYIVGTYMC